MIEEVPAPIGAPDKVVHADPKNVRRVAWAGLVGTMLEQYDFVIHGTATALIFNQVFLSNNSPPPP